MISVKLLSGLAALSAITSLSACASDTYKDPVEHSSVNHLTDTARSDRTIDPAKAAPVTDTVQEPQLAPHK